jgi:aminopeptidase YwaD
MRSAPCWRPLLAALIPLLSACTGPGIRVSPEPPGPYGRAVLDTLTSARYSGRGYDPSQGAARAAAFLEERFARLNLQPMGTEGYRFPFSFAVAQVSSAGLAVDGRALRLGTDYVPIAGSTTGAGEADAREAGQGARGGDEVLVLHAPTRRTYPLADTIAARLTPATRAVVVVDSLLPAFGGNRFRAAVPVFAVRTASWPAGAGRVRFALEGDQQAMLEGTDVVGAVRGTAVPDSFLVVTAHYDHLGRVFDAFGGPSANYLGANDNASGTAMLVALAREVARRPLRYTVVFAATGAEEVGLIGATVLAGEPTWPAERTRFLINLDMMAGGPGVSAFGGVDHPAEFARLRELLAEAGAPEPQAREQRPNSDHWPFVQRGVPGLFLISGGGFSQPYHHVGDVPETLEWDAWAMLFGVTHGLLRSLALNSPLGTVR